MNYHLNRNRLDMGIFSLEELQRRRLAGELTGAELVWCEGMAQWQTLEEVLREKFPASLPPAPVVPVKAKTNPILIVVACLVALAVCALVVVGILGFMMARQIPRVSATNSTDDSTTDSSSSPTESALALASKPVICDSNTVTAADVNIKRREFRVRQYVEGYKLRGERDNDCDALSLGFVQNWVACRYGGTVDTNLPPLNELGDQLAANPNCTDPIVLELAAENTAELHRKAQILEKAVTGFAHSRHLGYPKFFATVSLADNLMDDRPGRQPVLDAQALQDLRAALTDGSIDPGDQDDIGDTLVLGWGKGFFGRNQQAVFQMVQEQGDSFKWLALVLQGQFEINEAWRARGGGYVNTVTAQGAQGFSDHLALADKYLTRAWKLNPLFPLAADRMIYVSLGESGLADMRLWFDRATKAQIDFDEAWSDLRWGLRPRWYGDQDSMLALGITALNTSRFDTDVPRKLMDSVYDLESEMQLPPGKHIYDRADIWPRLQAMYEGYIAHDTADPDNRIGWRTHYAIVAYLAGKYGIARQQLQAIGWEPSAGSLTDWGIDLSLLPLEVAARTGTQSKAVAAAEASRNEGDTAGALKQYHDLAAAAGLDDRTRLFVTDRLASLNLENRLQTHEWVDFLPADTNMTGWHVERGHCTVKADGSLDVQSDENGHLLYSRARVGWNFEVRGQFEIQRSSTKSFQGGLVMGLPQFPTYNWYAFRMKRTPFEGDVASFSVHWSKNQLLSPVTLDSYTNSFDFRFQHGKISATVNNQEVFTDVAPPQEIAVASREFLLGLGAFNDSNDTVIRYRGVQVRSLAGE